MIKQFFVKQLKAGVMSCALQYVDGHFIPYSGRGRVHNGYSMQRRLAMPGQTAIFFHDATGRIVYFQLEEGKGDLRQTIEGMAAETKKHLDESDLPLFVSDRETWSVEHFVQMSLYRLLTWEKYTDAAAIQTLPATLFSEPLPLHNHQ